MAPGLVIVASPITFKRSRASHSDQQSARARQLDQTTCDKRRLLLIICHFQVRGLTFGLGSRTARCIDCYAVVARRLRRNDDLGMACPHLICDPSMAIIAITIPIGGPPSECPGLVLCANLEGSPADIAPVHDGHTADIAHLVIASSVILLFTRGPPTKDRFPARADSQGAQASSLAACLHVHRRGRTMPSRGSDLWAA